MHYLITGHTGFKGAWLTIWLSSQGHKVSGISLDPISGSLYEIAKINEIVSNDFRIDVRNVDEISNAIKSLSPDVVFHLAAQPLVRESYRDPRGTFETNAIGTLNIIEAVSATPNVKAQIIITTDKVYRNVNQVAGYVETDPLGGDDPYSASKAMADILAHSWVTSFNSPPTSIVRAGNVIGGGDVSPERLIPDLISAYSQTKVPTLRYPKAVRPWQHVLDCLNGYLMISDALLRGEKINEINIGPRPESLATVAEVANLIAKEFGVDPKWKQENSDIFPEASLLALSSNKAKEVLGWTDKLEFQEAIKWTVDWHKKLEISKDALAITRDQIAKFISA